MTIYVGLTGKALHRPGAFRTWNGTVRELPGHSIGVHSQRRPRKPQRDERFESTAKHLGNTRGHRAKVDTSIQRSSATRHGGHTRSTFDH